ncbi:MAG: hypothetical protein ACUVXI_14785 [bacterium]
MSLSEADTRAKLVDPALHRCGWTEDLVRREETERGIDIIDGKPRRRERGESKETKPLLVPYPGGEASRRYYQDAAIRALLEKIARQEKRRMQNFSSKTIPETISAYKCLSC